MCCGEWTLNWNAVAAIATVILAVITGYYAKITRDISRAATQAPQEAYELGLRSEREKHDRRVAEITDALSVITVPAQGDGVVIRISNPTNYPIRKASATVTMDHTLEDVLQPKDFMAYIEFGHLVTVVDDGLCWSEQIDGKNHSSVDIFAHEETSLSLFRFDHKETIRVTDLASVQNKAASARGELTKEYAILKVASPDGFGDLNVGRPQTRATVALIRKPYRFWVKIVSEDTRGKVWEFQFEDGPTMPVKKVRAVSIEEFREIQTRIRVSADQQTPNL
jgi:hypothetical protein